MAEHDWTREREQLKARIRALETRVSFLEFKHRWIPWARKYIERRRRLKQWLKAYKRAAEYALNYAAAHPDRDFRDIEQELEAEFEANPCAYGLTNPPNVATIRRWFKELDPDRIPPERRQRGRPSTSTD